MSSASSSSSAPDINAHTVFPDDQWPIDFGGFVVAPVCNFEDNYAYIIIDKQTNHAAFVDPAEPEKVLSVLSSKFPSSTLKAVLTTHKHGDHSGGNVYLAKKFPSLVIYGGANDNAPGVTNALKHGDTFVIGSGGTTVSILETACHTRGHVLYAVQDKAAATTTTTSRTGALFTGDTLFIAGCGKFMEGDAAQMYQNLYVTLPTLPQSLSVFCGHEYTVANLEFALFVEPDNEVIKQKLEWARRLREKLLPTIPSTLTEEHTFNPFLRAHQPNVVRRVVSSGKVAASDVSSSSSSSGVLVLKALRELKNENVHKKAFAAL